MSEVLHGNASGDQLNASKDKTQVYGLSGNDTLISDRKSDALLVGGSGDDSLIMLGGNGTLSGGDGSDIFELNYSATEKISAVIEDLDPAKDKIVVNFDGNFALPILSVTSGDDVIWTDGANFNLTLKSVRENDYFDGEVSDEAWEVLRLTNNEREKENLPWLTMADGLTKGASIRAEEITEKGEIGLLTDHTRLDNSSYSTVLEGKYHKFGENLQAGAESSAEVMDAWIGSPSHYANIMNPDFLKLGVGYNYKDLSKNEYYWTQLFADSLNNPEIVSAENLSGVRPEGHTVRKFIPLTKRGDIYNNNEYGATIAALGGNDKITNTGLIASISGGKDDDIIDNSGSFVTINAGTGNDEINLSRGAKYNLIEYNIGDGSDTVSGLHSTDTLSISGHEYTPATVGNNVIIAVGTNSITLADAASLSSINVEGTRSKIFMGTEGDDKLNNTVDGATIQAMGGDDKITISGENVLFVHESGDDTVRGFNSTSTLKVLGKNYSSITSGNDFILTNADKKSSITILNAASLNAINIVDANDRPLEVERVKNIIGTDDPDNLRNGSDDVTIQALGGDDTVTNKGDGVLIDGGADNDSISNDGSDVTITGGGGSDAIKNTGDNNSILGGADDDTIEISGDENTINAEGGDDFISVKGSRNVIEYVAGSGKDVIEGFNQTSTLRISGDVYTSTTSNKDVVVTVGEQTISLVGAADLNKINIVGTSQTETISSNYMDYNGHRYQLFDEGMTWEEAKAYCESLGGHLVVITDAAEQAAVEGLLKEKGTKNSYWMGGFKGGNEKLITLTEGDDTYSNFTEGVTIQALGGNDSIDNWRDSASIIGGTGSDTVSNGGDSVTISGDVANDFILNGYYFDSKNNDYGRNVIVDGGAGNDTLQNNGASSTINGGEGDDSIHNSAISSTLEGGDGDDYIYNYGDGSSISGGDGSDTISSAVYGTLSSGLWNTINAGAGDDYISLSGGNNQIFYNAGDGSDTVRGLTSNDTINISGTTYTRSTISNDVVLTVGDDSIRLVDAASLTALNIDGEEDTTSGSAVGVSINNDTSNTLITGTSGDDTIKNGEVGSSTIGANVSIDGAAGNDSITNYGDNVTITGDAGADDIINNAYNDSISGGDGNDTIQNSFGNNVTIDGGADNDSISNRGSSNVTINSGSGNDIIINSNFTSSSNSVSINAGEGNDSIQNYGNSVTIDGGAGGDSIENTGNNVLFTYTAGDGSDTISGFNATSTLSISGAAYSTTTSGDDIIVSVGDGSISLVGAASLNSVNITSGVASGVTIDNSTSNTVVTGTSGDDSITNSGDNVTIQALGGNDTVWNDGEDVTIDGGAGNDSIYYHGPDTGTTTNVSINGGANSDTIYNRSGDTVTLNGGAGNDLINNWEGYYATILGGEGNDTLNNDSSKYVTLDGGTGDDQISLTSSALYNLIQYKAGDGNDTIQGFNATSTLSISGAAYSTTTSGNDVIVTVEDGSITLKDAASLSALNIDGTLNSSDSWQWVTGETWDYDNWGTYQPDGDGSALMIYNSTGNGWPQGVWNDLNPTGVNGQDFFGKENFGLICEWETIPSSKLIVLTENADTYGESMESGTTLKALGGNDNINNWRGDSVTIDLGADDDYILNHSSYVLIEGDTGSDTVASWIDDDYSAYNTIRGGAGDDSIDNHGHHTLIEGNDGNDTLYNYVGDDGGIHQGYEANYSTVRGGRGNDKIDNLGNHVLIEGGTGNDTIANRNGAWFDDEAEYSTISGGAGKDSIFNQGDFVSIDGGAGDDTINNEGSNVTISSGAGEDEIYNRGERVSISGGADADTIDNHGSNDTILGGTGNDEISLSTASKNNFIRYADGDGNDTIWGATPDDTINILGVESYSSVKSGKNDLLIKVGNGSILLKDARNRPPKITLGESGSSGGTGGGGSGSSGGNSGGGSGGSNSSGGTSSSSNSNSAASGGNSASGSSGTSSGLSGSSGRGSRLSTRQISATTSPPVQTPRNQIISNYQSGSKINSSEGHTGAFFDGAGNFYSGSTTGAIVIPDATNKLIDLRDAAGNPFIKAYRASNAGVIDGRSFAGFEIINGSAGSDEIYAGVNGSQITGGTGNDTLTGGRGIDIFVSGKAQGNDLIRNASLLDKISLTDVTLNDITSTRENDKTVSLTFRTGSVITVESKDILSPSFVLSDGSYFFYNSISKSWRVMNQASENQKVYGGGEQTISSYQSGEKILFNAEYRGGSYDGEGNFKVNSSAGSLVVQNAMDKVIDLTNSAGNSIVKAYAASTSGVINGKDLTGYQIINGSAGADVICAGNGGSQLWGGAEADVLIGGDGADTFITGKTHGADLISNASTADNINLNDATLSDIVGTSESNGTISLSFNTGNVINVQSSEALSARFTLADGSAYRYNHARKTWQSA